MKVSVAPGVWMRRSEWSTPLGASNAALSAIFWAATAVVTAVKFGGSRGSTAAAIGPEFLVADAGQQVVCWACGMELAPELAAEVLARRADFAEQGAVSLLATAERWLGAHVRASGNVAVPTSSVCAVSCVANYAASRASATRTRRPGSEASICPLWGRAGLSLGYLPRFLFGGCLPGDSFSLAACAEGKTSRTAVTPIG